MPRFVLLVVCLIAGACEKAPASYVVLATTTSIANSGLLDALLPEWRREGGVEVRPTVAGSGRALAMLERGDADVVISHAPDAESALLARYPGWLYRKIMFNDFVLVGPSADPARVRDATSLDDAVRRIAESKVPFVSRGDESGTHERERALWRSAAVQPDPERLLVSGAAMAVTLRQASDRGAYTLTDRATFEQLRRSLQLELVWEGGPRLLNTYAVIARPEGPRHEDATRVADWLTDGAGRDVIARYRIEGSTVRPFAVWPHGVAGDTPRATPR